MADIMKFWNDFERHFIGFDDVQREMRRYASNSLKHMQTFPPYNIRKLSENTYSVELAVAGFGKQDITIELDGDKLNVTGKINQNDSEENFIFKGIAAREFNRQFTLSDQVSIKGATLLNGILKIALERITQDKAVKRIEIDEPTTSSPQYLTEDSTI